MDLSQVLQALIEDRQAYERDQAEECKRRVEEKQRKEVDLQMEQNGEKKRQDSRWSYYRSCWKEFKEMEEVVYIVYVKQNEVRVTKLTE